MIRRSVACALCASLSLTTHPTYADEPSAPAAEPPGTAPPAAEPPATEPPAAEPPAPATSADTPALTPDRPKHEHSVVPVDGIVPMDGTPVRLIGSEPGLTFYVRPAPTKGSAESEDYGELCAAPCDEKIDPGLQQLAVSKRGGKKVASEQSIIVARPSTIYAEYHSRNGLRAAGGFMIAGGVFLMAVSPFVSQNSRNLEGEYDHGPIDFMELALLVVAGGVAAGVGLSFALTPDTVEFTVKPGIARAVCQTRPAPSGNSASVDSLRAVSPTGLTAEMRF